MHATVTMFPAAFSRTGLSSDETSSYECKPKFDENCRRCKGPSHPEGLLVQDGAALVNRLDIAACQLEAEDG